MNGYLCDARHLMVRGMAISTVPDAEDGKRSVLGRAFEILDCFSPDRPEQTIAGLCCRTGLPPATVHRMLAGLVEWGAIERSSRGRYRLGRRLWKLGWGVTDARLMRDAARSFMVDLYTATGELTALGIQEDARAGDVIIVDFIGGRSVNSGWHSGHRVPALTSGPGLVYLAYGPPDVLGDTLRAAAPPRWRQADEFRLRQRLSEVKRAGVAVVHGAAPADQAWVTAPVFSAEGTVRSTLSLVVPERRLNAVRMGRAVMLTAQAITTMVREACEEYVSEAVTSPWPGGVGCDGLAAAR